jgi:endonuclease YncB( thermonuclease family)
MLKETLLYNYKAKVERIIDADTVEFTIDLGFKTYMRMNLRLAGIDAPEMKTQEGKDAKAWLEGQLPIGHEVTLSVYKAPDKYGRYLPYVTYNGLDINQELIKSGHAVEYHGGKREQ